MKFAASTFSAEIPDGWIDRSMLIWAAPPSAGFKVAPNLLVVHDHLAAGETLDGYANRQLGELLARARGFELIARRPLELCGRPAVELMFHMEAQGLKMTQRQIFALAEAGSGRVASLAATAAAAEFERAAPLFEAMASSWVWKD